MLVPLRLAVVLRSGSAAAVLIFYLAVIFRRGFEEGLWVYTVSF